MRDYVKEALAKAKQQQQATVKRLRKKGKSYTEIGKVLGVTRQRAQQIGKDAGLVHSGSVV